MFQNVIYSFNSFFYQFTRSELILIFTSIFTVVIALIALFTALGLFKKHRRSVDVRRMMAILSSLDLLYYSLDKHVRSWKAADSDGQSAEAQRFWRFTDLTELITRLQELKTLSRIHMEKRVHREIEALLLFLGDLILISYRGEDNSGKNYKTTALISSDEFDQRLNLIIKKVSRGLAMKNKKEVLPEELNDLITTIYQA